MNEEFEWRELGFRETVRFLNELKSQLLEKGGADATFLQATNQVLEEHSDAGGTKLLMTDEGESLFSLVKVDDDYDEYLNEVTTLETCSVSHSFFEFAIQGTSVVLTHRHHLLGRGGYSRVYQGTLCTDGVDGEKIYTVAVKVTEVHLDTIDEIDRWIRIVTVWQSAIHPSLVYCYHIGLLLADGVRGSANMYTAFEMATDGTLNEVLKKKEKLAEDDIKTILIDILHALCYLHNEVGVVHNDVKPQNILLVMDPIAQRLRYKLADFDSAYPISFALSEEAVAGLGETRSDACACVYGTPQYMSPESCRGMQFLPSNDVWSVGILTYQLSTGRLPWCPLELQVPSMITYSYRQDSSNSFGPILDEFEHSTDSTYSDNLKDLVRVCLAEKASDRPLVSRLFFHSFFSS